jgi:hyperosmotically inducible periplasmic protein
MEAEVSRIGPSVRLLAALALAGPVVACDLFEGRESVGEYFDDSSISNEIRGKFINDPVVHFGDIGVTTTNGVVHLSGRVNSPAERDRAGRIAGSVRGVRAVENGVLVR